MILVVTNRADVVVDLVVLELQAAGIEYLRLNTDALLKECAVTIDPFDAGRSELRAGMRRIRAAEISAVYWRRPAPPTVPMETTEAVAAFCVRESRALLDAFFSAIGGKWVSHPRAIATASAKPLQLREAKALGFTVPATVFTGDPSAARAFLAAAKGPVVVKTIDSPRLDEPGEPQIVFTRVVTADEVDDTLRYAPGIFQRLVEKEYDLRVTVVGDEVFATRIDSQRSAESRVDWRATRYDSSAHIRWTLPVDVHARCAALTHKFGLAYAAIDLCVDAAGVHHFLELNPNGEWGWNQTHVGYPIAARIVKELLAP